MVRSRQLERAGNERLFRSRAEIGAREIAQLKVARVIGATAKRIPAPALLARAFDANFPVGALGDGVERIIFRRGARERTRVFGDDLPTEVDQMMGGVGVQVDIERLGD